MFGQTLVLVGVAVIGAAILVSLAWYAFSRMGQPQANVSSPLLCAFREAGASEWTDGTVQYDGTLLVHRQIPSGVVTLWERNYLDLGVAERIDPSGISRRWVDLEQGLSVPCSYLGTSFQLALSPAHYTALRSWIEAAPPGWNSNVA